MFWKFKEMFFIGLEIFFELLQSYKNPQINSKDTFYVLDKKFSYTQLSFLFLLQKGSYCFYDDTDFFSFTSSERFLYLLRA